jgi:hypothetical protein
MDDVEESLRKMKIGSGQLPGTESCGGRFRWKPRPTVGCIPHNDDNDEVRQRFSSSFCVQTSSGAYPASCTVGIGGPFPGGKARPGRDADLSPSSAEVKNE